MTEQDDIDRVIAALKKVPAKKLSIIELVNRVCGEDGEIDYNELEKLQPDVNLAIAEAKMYGAHTIVAVDALKRIKPEVPDVGP